MQCMRLAESDCVTVRFRRRETSPRIHYAAIHYTWGAASPPIGCRHFPPPAGERLHHAACGIFSSSSYSGRPPQEEGKFPSSTKRGESLDFTRHCRVPANGCTWKCRPGSRAQDAREVPVGRKGVSAEGARGWGERRRRGPKGRNRRRSSMGFFGDTLPRTCSAAGEALH